MISLVVLTHNRVGLLSKCVENVLARSSDATREIVIWNNASTDGTGAYLRSLDDPRITVVDHETNIGQNAYAHAFALTTQPYLLELDDDVTDAPDGWDRTLLDAFERLPRIGFLAANLVDDPNDVASYVMHHHRPHEYTRVEENGIVLLKGPVGGGCALTSRELHDRVGGFQQSNDQTFWLEDEAYIKDINRLGFEAAFLEGLRVHHTGGPYYAPYSPEKERYWRSLRASVKRKLLVKRALYRLPLFARANRRYRWFQPPDPRELVNRSFDPPAA